MNQITLDATSENLDRLTSFINEKLMSVGCPRKAMMEIDVVIDELFSNIANYAYHPDVGPATVIVEFEEDPICVMITFLDNGVPFDPLAKEDPDTSLSAHERSIGGLGVYIVKQMMDDVTYEYKNGQNILRIKKNVS